ncbi:coiled-coil domain-containing protein 12 [Alligator sinensis]|uniref:Coiled-coil domain-containing protein 12 n=1 Tax=Alligator sinensis TaxID=38654 RepID=A0A3Q0GYA3_ALLSI|nr:coiled-coil domain-containing protein 12 [Alligator sinensis]
MTDLLLMTFVHCISDSHMDKKAKMFTPADKLLCVNPIFVTWPVFATPARPSPGVVVRFQSRARSPAAAWKRICNRYRVALILHTKDSSEPASKQLREDDEESAVKHMELRLRNYNPEDEELKKRKVPQAKPASVEEKVKDQLEAAKPEPIIEEVDLANLAPRKPDWDLKRDVAKKLEKLEKRTQRAIAELIRERLRGQEDDLALAVGSAKQEGSDSD